MAPGGIDSDGMELSFGRMAKGYLPYEVDQGTRSRPAEAVPLRPWPDTQARLKLSLRPVSTLPFAGELEGSALPSNGAITTEFRRALPDGLLAEQLLEAGERRCVAGEGEGAAIPDLAAASRSEP